MYLGQVSVSDWFWLCTTKLHMDMTDAYNVMQFAAKCLDGKPGYALWHIFEAKDAFLLRKFLREACGFTGYGDPIHSQTVYLTPQLLKTLFTTYGVRPFTIHQYPGDIVFIPAYCAHQVWTVLIACLSL